MTYKYCKIQNIPFPKVELSAEEEKNPKECYIFADAEDPRAPIVIHFPLVNDTFKEFKEPGKCNQQNCVLCSTPGMCYMSADGRQKSSLHTPAACSPLEKHRGHCPGQLSATLPLPALPVAEGSCHCPLQQSRRSSSPVPDAMSCQERCAKCWSFSGTGKRESKERSRDPWKQGDKGLLKDLLVGWKAAAAGPWSIQAQGWPWNCAFPRQAACGGEGGAGAEGTSFLALRDSRLGHRDLGRGSMCGCGGRGSI